MLGEDRPLVYVLSTKDELDAGYSAQSIVESRGDWGEVKGLFRAQRRLWVNVGGSSWYGTQEFEGVEAVPDAEYRGTRFTYGQKMEYIGSGSDEESDRRREALYDGVGIVFHKLFLRLTANRAELVPRKRTPDEQRFDLKLQPLLTLSKREIKKRYSRRLTLNEGRMLRRAYQLARWSGDSDRASFLDTTLRRLR